MTYVVAVSVWLLLIGHFASAANITCESNEVLDNCPRDCASDYCPDHRDQDKTPCPKPAVCPPAACKCAFNYRRAKNGTCIPTEHCPPFKCDGLNEMYDPCPSYCPGDDCRNANPTGECPFLTLLVVNCSPACSCIPHYWRLNGVCVPYLSCPGVAKEQHDGNEQISLDNI